MAVFRDTEPHHDLAINGSTSSKAALPNITNDVLSVDPGKNSERHVQKPEETHNIPAWTPYRKRKVVTVGAGFSGLIFAHKLQHQHPEFQELIEHQIYEARDDVGGTWLVNTYPGVQCDVPAHIYVSLAVRS